MANSTDFQDAIVKFIEIVSQFLNTVMIKK